MGYKVFISHSTHDQGLVVSLARLLSEYGVEVFVAEWYLAPGEQVDKKVFEQIRSSNCVVVLLTRNGIRSNWVQQEIGYALDREIPLIPLVEEGVDQKDLAALEGKEYIQYNPDWPGVALSRTSTYVHSLKLRKQEQEKTLLVAGGILSFLLLFSARKK